MFLGHLQAVVVFGFDQRSDSSVATKVKYSLVNLELGVYYSPEAHIVSKYVLPASSVVVSLQERRM